MCMTRSIPLIDVDAIRVGVIVVPDFQVEITSWQVTDANIDVIAKAT